MHLVCSSPSSWNPCPAPGGSRGRMCWSAMDTVMREMQVDRMSSDSFLLDRNHTALPTHVLPQSPDLAPGPSHGQDWELEPPTSTHPIPLAVLGLPKCAEVCAWRQREGQCVQHCGSRGLLWLMVLAVGSTVYFYSLNQSGCSLPFKSPESNYSW